MVQSGSVLRANVRAPRLDPEPMPADLVMCLMAAAQRTAFREPLRHDAPNATVAGRYGLCGWCGNPGPCALHQPRTRAFQLSTISLAGVTDPTTPSDGATP